MAEWFEDWFGEEYLALYPHRDQADADAAVALIARTIPWRDALKVLDVACGPGRHALALEARGARPVGVDLSLPLLRRARTVTRSPLVRSDMRYLPLRPRTFDLTINLFTSFGYFTTDAEHQSVLDHMIDTVRPGGWFALDFLNAALVRDGLILSSDTSMNGQAVHITRRISADDRFVEKTIQTESGRVFRERVRLFTSRELEVMMQPTLDIVARYGDYSGAPLATDSPRVFLIGRRP